MDYSNQEFPCLHVKRLFGYGIGVFPPSSVLIVPPFFSESRPSGFKPAHDFSSESPCPAFSVWLLSDVFRLSKSLGLSRERTMDMSEEVAQCASCHGRFPKSHIRILTQDDTQGYYRSGVLVCPSCLETIHRDVLTLEDEDLED